MVWYGMVYVPQVMVRVFPPAHARVCENSLRLYSPHIIGPVAHGVGHFFGRCFGIRVLSCDLLCSPHRACKRLVAASGSLLEAAAHRAPRSALRSALALSTPALHETR